MSSISLSDISVLAGAALVVLGAVVAQVILAAPAGLG
jgi:hypothetical protein